MASKTLTPSASLKAKWLRRGLLFNFTVMRNFILFAICIVWLALPQHKTFSPKKIMVFGGKGRSLVAFLLARLVFSGKLSGM
jgi:hypothetical protein